MVTREQSVFRLAFAYQEDLVNRARELYYAHFDGETSTWTSAVCTQNLEILKGMYYEGLIDVPPESLLEEGEVVEEAPLAVLRSGSVRRCYLVSTALRDETMYAKLKAIPGSLWEKKAGAMSYPSSSGVALAEFVDRGLIADPERLLSPADVVVAFDGRSGTFSVRGDDNAKKAFTHYFPRRDVVTGWQERGHDVAFDSDFTREVYFGELARDHGHVQPEGLLAELYPFQSQAVAIAVERTGLGVFDSPGLGKTLIAIATGYELMQNRQEIPRVLCVVPGSARTQWAREITRFTGQEDVVVVAGDLKTRTAAYEKAEAEKSRWVIVNYDILTRDFKYISPLASGALIVADEAHRCFPGGTTVLTETGPKDIRVIVENQQAASVLAWDEQSRTFAYKPVTAWMSSPAPDDLVRVVHARGEFTCTQSHPVWTEERGYVAASELCAGDTLRYVQHAAPTTHRAGERFTISDMVGGLLRGIVDEGAMTSLYVGTDRLDAAFLAAYDKLREVEYNYDVDVRFAVALDEYGESAIFRNALNSASQRGLVSFDGPEFRDMRLGREKIRASIDLNNLPGSPEMYRALTETFLAEYRTPRRVGRGLSRVESVDRGNSTSELVYNIEVADLNSYVADGVVVHNCKNPQAKRTQALRKIAQRTHRRLALTGTPVENEPGEWFSILSGYAIPNIFGTATDFLGRYQYPGRFGGYEGARRLPELRERSKPHYIRHTKAEVAQHLPPLRPYTIRLDPDPTYAAALRRAHQEARDEIKTAALDRHRGPRNALDNVDEEIATAAEMTAVGMLKLLCISPRLVVNSESAAAKALCAAGIVPDEDGPKLDYLRARVAEYHAQQERVIVFCSSRAMTDLVATRFTEDRIPHVLYTGETSDKDRDAAVLAFTTPRTDEVPGPSVMIATDAGSEALNLGKCCSTIINLDVPWKATTLEQRGNRVHRIDGTAAKYEVINLVLTGTLERGLLAMVERKADLQDAILGESGGRTRTTGGKGRNFFEQALESWSEDPE
jgi:hypothetical protein